MYASELADKQRGKFLLIYGDQEAAQAARLLRALDPPPEIVVCAVPGDAGWRYFLIRALRARQSLKSAGQGQSAAEAFGDLLDEPADCLRASDPVSAEPRAFVIEENGLLVGCYSPPGWRISIPGVIGGWAGIDLEHHMGGPITVGMRDPGRDPIRRDAVRPGSVAEEVHLPVFGPYIPGGVEIGKGVETGAEEPASERYLQSEVPEGLVVGEEGDLVVWITCAPDESGSLRLNPALNLRAGETLDVVVRAEAGLKLTGQSYGRLAVPRGKGDSARLRIGMRAEHAGLGRLKVYCLHRGVPLGCIAQTVMVYADEDAARQAQSGYRAVGLAPLTERFAPTLTLWVFEERIDEQPAVRYLLHDAQSNLPPREYGPLLLDQAPRERFSLVLAEIEAMLRSTPPDRIEDAQIELQMRGEILFQELFPPELQQVLAGRQSEIESIHVLSQEAWIPWEMVRVYGVDAEGTMQGRYLCEYTLTRWNPDYLPQPELSLKSIGVVAPVGKQQAERIAGFKLLREFEPLGNEPKPYQVAYLTGGLSQIVKQLSGGAHTCLHFAGYERTMDEKLRSGLRLADGRLLYAQQFGGSLSACGKTHPLVLLDARPSTPDAPRVTGLDGWANQFMAIGAAAFVGTHWSVSEESASAFAGAFYGFLLSGKPLGVALREARRAMQDLTTLDWLAYAGFCDPAAKVS